jgi:hypothetical protein
MQRSTFVAIVFVVLVAVVPATSAGAAQLVGAQEEDQGPVAVIKFDASGSVVQFDASGSQSGETSIQLYRWDFGDGRTGSGIAPRHNFASEGRFTVTLTVTTQKGRTDTTEKVVDLTRQEPQRDEVENVTGHPVIRSSVSDNEFQPGDETSLSLVVFNDGNVTNGSNADETLQNAVTTAQYVRASVEDDHDVPVSVRTNERFLRALPDGETAPVSFGLTVDSDAEPGTYRLPVNVTYNHTEEVDPETGRSNETTRGQTLNVTLVVEETPRFEVVDVESDTRVGSTGSVEVTVENTGDERAHSASVSLTSRNSDLLVGQSATGSRFAAGSWDPGERRTVSFRVSAARSASQQQYTFDTQVTYENSEGNTRQSRSLSLGVTPEAEQTFSVVSVTDSVAVGDEGTVTLELRNDGPVTVEDATVTVQSSSANVVFGESASASQYVGTWAPDEVRTVAVNATALPDAEVRNYTLSATVDYDDRDGDPGESRPATFGLRPAPEREYEFSAGEFDSDLRVGEEGTLSGTITNTGDRQASNVVVVFESQSQTVTPTDREYPVGTLEPGESGTVEFELDVGGSADAGPKQFTLRPRYRNDDDEPREAESFDVRAEIGPERDVFAVDVADATVPQGEGTALAVTVRNDGDEPVTDISAQLFADSPISVGDDEAFVGALEPGEETTIQFEISASGSALVKTYPVEMDFQYDDAEGDTQLTDTYRVPVQVTEPEDDGGPSILVIGVVVLLVVLVGFVAYRQFG